MLRVSTYEALPGMRLAVDVLHPERGFRLLSAGYELDQTVIAKLRELGIREFWIDYPHTQEIEQYVSPEIIRQHARVVHAIAGMFDSLHREAFADLDFTEYRHTLREVIEATVQEPRAASYITELGGEADNELRHASEVCLLSVLLGLKLQGYLIRQRSRLAAQSARNVVSLGIGAMMHDIGMTALDPEVRERFERTRDESDAEWQEHVVAGHKLVTGRIAPSASGVVLHHHQYFDGSGFPKRTADDGEQHGLAGDEIHVFARIVCVANHFDRLRRLPDGRIQPRVRVLREMLSGSLTPRFDPMVLAALSMVVPAYPPGSVVTLNDGQRVLVVAWHPEAPCQPTVRPLGEDPEDDDALPRYDLRQQTDLHVQMIDGIDVSEDNFRVAPQTLRKLHDAA